MKEYTYTGPLSGVSLKGHEDVMLHPGAVVSLPEDHVYTARLIKRGWLVELPALSQPGTELNSVPRDNKTKKEQTDAS